MVGREADIDWERKAFAGMTMRDGYQRA